VEKAVGITYVEFVFAVLEIQHATRMRRITLRVPCLALQHFTKLSQNGIIFEKKITLYKMCFVFLYDFYLKHSTKN